MICCSGIDCALRTNQPPIMVYQRPGANVERLVRENETIARNEAMMKELHKTEQVAEWHERQYQKSGGVPGGARAREEAEEELRAAREAVQETRRAKMRELVAADNLKYEAELDAMGLTVEKERY